GPFPFLFSILISGLYSLFFSQFSYASFAGAESSFGSFLKPFSIANCCAPSPTSIIWGVVSIIFLATETGCFICSIAPTEPRLACSSIMHASSVTMPSLSGYPPRPMQQSIVSSTYLAPASTASNDRPFFDKIFQASAFTSFPLFQVETTIGFVRALPLVAIFFKESNGAASVESCKNFLLLSIVIIFSNVNKNERKMLLFSSDRNACLFAA